MIEIRRNLIVRHDLWFDEPWDRGDADLMVFYHWSEAVNPAASLDVCSLEIDLTQDLAAIWSGFAASTRNEINRAGRDSISFEAWTDPPRPLIDEFFAFKRRFDSERGKDDPDPVWMYDYAAQGGLLLTRACAPDGAHLVWHSYYRGPGWVRQLHSTSLFQSESTPEARRMVGRANRGLHWADIQECRRLGVERFDLGGWYSGSTDEKLLRVNAFKEQFGGRKTRRYHSMLPASAKGKLYLKTRERLKHTHELVHFV